MHYDFIQWTQIVGSAGQLLLGLGAVWVAVVANRFVRRQAKLQMTTKLFEMTNDYDKVVLSDDRHVEFVAKMRPPVSGDLRSDYVALIYLNRVAILFELEKDKFISPFILTSIMKHAAGFFLVSGRDYLRGMLTRGYADDFQRRFLSAFDQLVREKGVANEAAQ